MPRPGTEFVYLQGKAAWVRTKAPNPWGKWTVTLYPNAESLEKVRALQAEGCKNVLKKDDDGYNVTFSRPTEKEDRLGRKYGLTPVEVVDKSGQPFDENIGNGSDITVKLEVYQHKTPGGGKAKAARLLGIRVDNLVPYTRDDFDEDQLRAVKDLEKQPAQPQW